MPFSPVDSVYQWIESSQRTTKGAYAEVFINILINMVCHENIFYYILIVT